MPIAKLDRTVLRLSGEGAAPWLEGLITNTLSGDLTFAALLTPQGKIIADFFVWQNDDIYIDTPVKFGEALFKRLKMYRLRAPITIEDVSENVSIYALWDDERGLEDPRHKGIRRLKSEISLEKNTSQNASQNDWDQHRLSLGLPDSQWDFGSAETFPHNVNMDKLSGVDFKKGCFVGQEVVSRMHRKTDVRKRLCGISFEGDITCDKITAGDRVIGDVVYVNGAKGMAMIRLDRLANIEHPPRVGPTLIAISGAD